MPDRFAASRWRTAVRTSDDVVRTHLPVVAHTKLRPRFGRGRAYTPLGTRNWEEQLAWLFIERHGRPRLDGPVRVELIFGGVQSNQDIDNLVKSCLDALNGIAFEDDR